MAGVNTNKKNKFILQTVSVNTTVQLVKLLSCTQHSKNTMVGHDDNPTENLFINLHLSVCLDCGYNLNCPSKMSGIGATAAHFKTADKSFLEYL